MKSISKNNLIIIYLDQFASSGIFESTSIEWLQVKKLITKGYNKGQLICPLSVEHFIETSQKHKNKAIFLDSEFYKISGGYAFKPELFITSQLISSLIRKNNITLRTYMDELLHEKALANDKILNRFDTSKKLLNNRIEEATDLANEIRKVERHKRVDIKTRKELFEVHKSISVSEFIRRLNDLLRSGIRIRGVSFTSGDVPHWIDQIIFQLINKHKITPKETKKLIKELKINGFKNIPTLDIRTSLSAIISVLNKKETVNDQIDIMRISSGLPISDILLTDTARKSEIIELEFDKKYGTKVFSGKKHDLTNLIFELESKVK